MSFNKKHLKKAYVFYAFKQILKKTNCIISTCYMRCVLYLCDITVKGNLYFYGVTYTSFHPSSKVKIGRGCTFRSSFSSNSIGLKQKCFLSTGKNAKLEIGDDCGLSGTVINAENLVKVGNRVFFGANVTVSDSDRHPLNAKARFANEAGVNKPVIIEDDVWLGMNVVVMKGVRIGQGAVVAANSVVLKDIPSNVVAAGIPAIKVKDIQD